MGDIGIMENEMETTILGLWFRVCSPTVVKNQME